MRFFLLRALRGACAAILLRRVGPWIVAVVLLAFGAVPAAAGTAAGYTQIVEGRVTATASATERVLAEHLPVFELDTLRTYEDSRGQFLFDDESQLSMGPSSEVAVSSFYYVHEAPHNALKMVLDYGQGVYSFSAGNITGNPEGMVHRTPLLAMGIRGTEIGLSVGPEGDAIALLYHGPIQVTDRETGEQYTLREGQMITKRRGEKAALGVIPASYWKRMDCIAVEENPPGPAIPSDSPCRR